MCGADMARQDCERPTIVPCLCTAVRCSRIGHAVIPSSEPMLSAAPNPVALARDRLARHAAPFLWQEAARRMAERLPLLKLQPQQLLDIGCGWGDGLELLRQQYPGAAIRGLEPAPKLAALARRRVAGPWWKPARNRIEVECASLLPPPGQAQMLWSNLALPWAGDPVVAFAAWNRALAADGLLLFTTLGPDTLHELRQLGWPTPSFPDMHDLGDMLVGAGFAEPVMDMEMVHLSYASAEAALAELAQLGRPPGSAVATGLRTPRQWRRLLQSLQGLAGSDGRVSLRFELVYGHAWQPSTVRAQDGVAVIGLEQLRSSLKSK